MRCCIEAFRDEQSVLGFSGWNKSLANSDKLLSNLSNHVQSNFNLLLGIICFYSCTNYSYVIILLADLMHWGNHHNIDVIFSAKLSLRQDDLNRRKIFRSWNRMVKNTDASYDFLNKLNSLFKTTSQSIGWVTNNCRTFCNSLFPSDSNNFTIFKKNLFNISIKHECSSVNCTDTRKTLWNSP